MRATCTTKTRRASRARLSAARARFACRLLPARRADAGPRKREACWPLHVSRWLGHTKLTMTDTYLSATTQLLHELNERKPLTLVR